MLGSEKLYGELDGLMFSCIENVLLESDAGSFVK